MPKTKKEVHQYDLEGNYIQSFSSVSEAAKAINAKQPNISTVCDVHYRTVNGYRFTTVKHTRLFKYTNTKGWSKKVYLYDLDGNLVKEFRTHKEAAKYFELSTYQLQKYLKAGTIDEYKISSVKVDKFVEFKSRRLINY